MTDLALPKQLARLYAMLESGDEVAISTLHEGLDLNEPRDPRHAQQVVGTYVIRLNRRLKAAKQRVEPGRVKQTYALVSV